jgi:hypothetical protein
MVKHRLSTATKVPWPHFSAVHHADKKRYLQGTAIHYQRITGRPASVSQPYLLLSACLYLHRAYCVTAGYDPRTGLKALESACSASVPAMSSTNDLLCPAHQSQDFIYHH